MGFHLKGPGLEVRAHLMLTLIIFACFLLSLLELLYPESALLSLTRAAAVFFQGTWFYQIAHILYSGMLLLICRCCCCRRCCCCSCCRCCLCCCCRCCCSRCRCCCCHCCRRCCRQVEYVIVADCRITLVLSYLVLPWLAALLWRCVASQTLHTCCAADQLGGAATFVFGLQLLHPRLVGSCCCCCCCEICHFC
jgi:hypothetical protein